MRSGHDTPRHAPTTYSLSCAGHPDLARLAAGLIGTSMDEALEIFFGLPGWHDYTELDPPR
ncbi:hypothetical protein [Streptomyces sp. NPDC090131]|uniref:hypothetical protein n=1 Tax=Streptomyces sp. NPDC090131 TaxID=3365954 RepID=UPI00382B2181